MAYLALQPRRVPRALVAGTLWVEGSQQRANGNLRSSLWRLNKRAKDLVDARAQTLSLVSSAWVDTNEVSEASGKLHANGRKASDAELHPDRFAQELLPGWYDEWAMVERERLRQVSLRALEVISRAPRGPAALRDGGRGCDRGHRTRSAPGVCAPATHQHPSRRGRSPGGDSSLRRVHLSAEDAPGNPAESASENTCRVTLPPRIGDAPEPQWPRERSC